MGLDDLEERVEEETDFVEEKKQQELEADLDKITKRMQSDGEQSEQEEQEEVEEGEGQEEVEESEGPDMDLETEVEVKTAMMKMDKEMEDLRLELKILEQAILNMMARIEEVESETDNIDPDKKWGLTDE